MSGWLSGAARLAAIGVILRSMGAVTLSAALG